MSGHLSMDDAKSPPFQAYGAPPRRFHAMRRVLEAQLDMDIAMSRTASAPNPVAHLEPPAPAPATDPAGAALPRSIQPGNARRPVMPTRLQRNAIALVTVTTLLASGATWLLGSASIGPTQGAIVARAVASPTSSVTLARAAPAVPRASAPAAAASMTTPPSPVPACSAAVWALGLCAGAVAEPAVTPTHPVEPPHEEELR